MSMDFSHIKGIKGIRNSICINIHWDLMPMSVYDQMPFLCIYVNTYIFCLSIYGCILIICVVVSSDVEYAINYPYKLIEIIWHFFLLWKILNSSLVNIKNLFLENFTH